MIIIHDVNGKLDGLMPGLPVGMTGDALVRYTPPMQSKATSVKEYLAELPEDRRAAIAAVRKIILENLVGGFEEGMQYGMIGYYVPHRLYPAGYHCDPKQPLPYACLASQKNHMAVYLMGLYLEGGDRPWFESAWK